MVFATGSATGWLDENRTFERRIVAPRTFGNERYQETGAQIRNVRSTDQHRTIAHFTNSFRSTTVEDDCTLFVLKSAP
jgi:hypothetical protein